MSAADASLARSPPRRGQAPLPARRRTVHIDDRRWEVLQTLGGSEWLAAAIDEAARREKPGRGKGGWTPAMDAMLGTDSDRRIAARLGRTHVAVLHRRQKLGIAASHRRPRIVWTPDMDEVVVTHSIPDAAKALGVAYHSFQSRRAKLSRDG